MGKSLCVQQERGKLKRNLRWVPKLALTPSKSSDLLCKASVHHTSHSKTEERRTHLGAIAMIVKMLAKAKELAFFMFVEHQDHGSRRGWGGKSVGGVFGVEQERWIRVERWMRVEMMRADGKCQMEVGRRARRKERSCHGRTSYRQFPLARLGMNDVSSPEFLPANKGLIRTCESWMMRLPLASEIPRYTSISTANMISFIHSLIPIAGRRSCAPIIPPETNNESCYVQDKGIFPPPIPLRQNGSFCTQAPRFGISNIEDLLCVNTRSVFSSLSRWGNIVHYTYKTLCVSRVTLAIIFWGVIVVEFQS